MKKNIKLANKILKKCQKHEKKVAKMLDKLLTNMLQYACK